MRTLLLLLALLSFQSCQLISDVPKELKVTFEYIEDNWEPEAIESFRDTAEYTACIRQHFGMGIHLRNNLINNHKQSTRIKDFFDSYGIFHFDDMSAIILRSYHRHLNGKDIKLQQQADYYQAFWEPILACEKEQTRIAFENYHKYSIGDTIHVLMPVRDNSAFNYSCYLDWEYEEEKDLHFQGKIMAKSPLEDSENLSFMLIVLAKNHLDTEVENKEVNIGDSLSVWLNSSWKIPPEMNDIKALQGQWQHTKDLKAKIHIGQNNWTDYYDEETFTKKEKYTISWKNKLPQFVDTTIDAQFIVLTNKTDTMYFELLGLTDNSLSLMHFPTGRLHLYEKEIR